MSVRAELYDFDAARDSAQLEKMQRLQQDGICIFCPEHVAEHHARPIAITGEHWYVTENAFPYPGVAAHYLIISHAHVASFHELPDAAGAELWTLKRALWARYDHLACATVERSGAMQLNGGSIAHLHTHWVALPALPTRTVRFRVSAHAQA